MEREERKQKNKQKIRKRRETNLTITKSQGRNEKIKLKLCSLFVLAPVRNVVVDETWKTPVGGKNSVVLTVCHSL